MWYWVYFVVLISVMYVGISTIGRLSGGSGESLYSSIVNLFTPLILLLVILTNVLFAAGIYYGFIVSSNALSISIAIGIITAFCYSVLLLGVTITPAKLLGLSFVLVGIYLLR